MMDVNSDNRPCPNCGASLPTNMNLCRCGHHFNPTESLARVLEEEKLYQDYLAARSRQAVSAAIVAQTAHKADPGEPKKASQAMHAIHEAETARAALMQQNNKVAQLVQTINKTAETERATLAARAGRARLVHQAERAAQKVARVKQCPECKTAAPVDIPRCKCGYIFSDVERIGGKPSVSPLPRNTLVPPKKS